MSNVVPLKPEQQGELSLPVPPSTDALGHALGYVLGVIDANMPPTLPADVESLAQLLAASRVLKSMASDLERQVEAATAAAMPRGIVRVDGVGTLERKPGSANTYWDNEGVFTRLIAYAKDPRNRCEPWTGEIVLTELERFAKDVRDACAVGYWRKTELGGLGINADDYCETKPGKTSVVIR